MSEEMKDNVVAIPVDEEPVSEGQVESENSLKVAEEDIYSLEASKAYSLVRARMDGLPESFPNDTLVIFEQADPGHYMALRFESAEAVDVVIAQLQTMRDEFVDKVQKLQEIVRKAEEEAEAEEAAKDDGDMDRESESADADSSAGAAESVAKADESTAE